MLRNASIGFKLTLLMALASTLALLLASGGFLYYDSIAFRTTLAAGLQTKAEIIGSNCGAAVAFRNEADASENLSSLKAESDISAAALYTPDGKLFAKWGRTRADILELPPGPRIDGVRVHDNSISVFYTIQAGKESAGIIYIDSTMASWHQRRRQYTYMVGMLLVTGIVLSILVGSRLQRIVSGPIQTLASVMRQVAEEQDYSHRVHVAVGGEIGQLNSGFNLMLDELEEHRNELRHANEDLERRVRIRTVELQQEVAERTSAEQRLEVSRQTLEEFFENASIGLLLLGPDGAILRANRMELDTMGFSSDEYVGHDYFGFNTAPDEARHLLDLLAHGESLDTYETQVRCKSGELKTIALSCNALRDADGVFIHARCFTRDVTALKEAEAAERARVAAERASSAKSEFLSRMSHELRTPMNAILGFAQLLQLDDLEAEQQDSVGQIRSAGEHLLRLINEVLDISRIEAGALTISLEPVSVCDVATEVRSLIMPLATQREISVSLDLDSHESTHVLADRQRLTQVVLNLVSNAVKYNRNGGSVTIKGGWTEDAKVRISVIDTGVGIPAEKSHHIFQPFERLGAEGTTIEGTGLGLALSKRLVEAMEGVIGFETGLNGTTFYVDLPSAVSQLVVMQQSDPEVHTEPLAATNSKRSVLLIEDNMSNVRLMEKILENRPNVKLLVAMQGTLGYDLAVEHCPDLILLDLNLPDCHGYDLLIRMKAVDRLADIPIVVVSADATQAQVTRLLAAGAFRYLTKPLNVKELLRTLDEIFIQGVEKVA